MATNWPQTQWAISQQILLLFYPEITIILITAHLCAMLRSASDGKITVFSLLRDHVLGFLTFLNSNYPARRAWPFLTLPIPVSHSFHLCWKLEKESVFAGKQGEFIVSFHCLHRLAWNLTFFRPSPGFSCKPSTISSERGGEKSNKGLGSKWAYHQQTKQSTWTNMRVKRGWDNTTTIEHSKQNTTINQ